MDLIVLLPGILGSELAKDGRTVWGFSTNAIGGALVRRSAQINQDLELPAELQGDVELDDGVRPVGLMPDLHLVPGLWKVDGYTSVRAYLQTRLQPHGFGYEEFAYDWRRDNRYSARRLQQFLENKISRWRKASGRDSRVVLIAHSMAGNIARYYLEVMAGWEDGIVRSLITLGTPYRGSVNALEALLNGSVRGPVDLTAMTRSFTSVYQLLPTYPVLDPGDGDYRRLTDCGGLTRLDDARVGEALAFHHAISENALANRADARWNSKGYDLSLIVGRSQRTPQAAALLDDGSVLTSRSYRGQFPGGDGTVPRGASIPREEDSARALRMYYSTTCHAALQSSRSVLSQISMAIRDQDFDFDQYRGPLLPDRTETLASLTTPDLMFTGDEAEIIVETKDAPTLLLELDEIDGRAPSTRIVCSDLKAGLPRSVTVGGLTSGVFRVALLAPGQPPLIDHLVVADA